MHETVAAIVVTYNRKTLLPECLEGLLNQTAEIEKIIIIDNASTDGTHALLCEAGYLENEKIAYYGLASNTGGAGGFNAGLKEALLGPYNWFWLMDDDVTAETTCLENLLKYRDVSECLHPRKLLPNNEFLKWEHSIDVATLSRTGTNDLSFANGKPITFTNVGCFEGMLVSRRIVEQIGLPDPNYFISEDDTLFGFKASAHTNVSYVASALMKRLLPLGNAAPWKAYYLIRNQFFLRSDALNHFKLKTSKKDDAIFLLSQIIDVLRFSRKGMKYIVPAFRGFFHGMKYQKRYEG